jgi:hypothetical protein
LGLAPTVEEEIGLEETQIQNTRPEGLENPVAQGSVLFEESNPYHRPILSI